MDEFNTSSDIAIQVEILKLNLQIDTLLGNLFFREKKPGSEDLIKREVALELIQVEQKHNRLIKEYLKRMCNNPNLKT
jgi:hypothetical protein